MLPAHLHHKVDILFIVNINNIEFKTLMCMIKKETKQKYCKNVVSDTCGETVRRGASAVTEPVMCELKCKKRQLDTFLCRCPGSQR